MSTVSLTEGRTRTVDLTIDGREVTVPEGTTIWTAARDAGIDIPVLCHDERFDPVGVCRMCVVDAGGPGLRGRLRPPVRGGHDRLDVHARRRGQPRGAHRAAGGRPAATRTGPEADDDG